MKNIQAICSPSSSSYIRNNRYLNFASAECTGVFAYPHQVSRAGSIPASARMN